jgi:hypothetical protein
MQIRVIALTAVATLLLCAASASAHHSNSAYEVEKVVTLTGTVKSWKWSNPHTWLTLTVANESGETVEWELEGRAPGCWAGSAGQIHPEGRKVTST